MAKRGGEAPKGGQPLHLLRTDPATNKFVLGEDALAALRSVKTPIAIAAVCGRARQGKSFILNAIARKAAGGTAGFAVGPTQRPCTKGLWMWSQPIPQMAPDGSKYHLILLDTEGIDAYDQTNQYSAQIFSLAVLLSSLFVYNQFGGIDESALDRLSLVTEMTKLIHVKAGGGSVDEIGHFSPSFLWLLRDFYLDLSEDGRPITPGDYLETALRAVAGKGPAAESKNEIRKGVKAVFPDRGCFALVRPMNDEKELQNLEDVPPERLRPEFRAGLDALTSHVLLKAAPKRIGADTLSGAALAALAVSYVKAINEGAVPAITTTWQSVADGENRAAVEQAEAAYAAAFDGGKVACDEEAMQSAHQLALNSARDRFAQESVGSADIRRPHEERLAAALAARFAEFRKRKLLEASAACAEAAAAAAAHVQQAARAQGATVASVVAAVEEAAARYLKVATGPQRWEKLLAVVQDAAKGPLADVAARAVAAERARADAAEAAAAAATKEAQKAQAAEAAARKEGAAAAARAESLQREAGDLRVRAAQLEATLDGKNELLAKSGAEAAAAAAEAGRLRAKVEAAEAASQEAAARARREVEEARGAGAREAEGRSRAEAAKQEAERRIAELQARADTAEGKKEALATEKAAAVSEAAEQRRRADAAELERISLREEIAKLRAAKDSSDAGAAAARKEAEQAAAAARADAERLRAQLQRAQEEAQQQQQQAAAAAAAAATAAGSKRRRVEEATPDAAAAAMEDADDGWGQPDENASPPPPPKAAPAAKKAAAKPAAAAAAPAAAPAQGGKVDPNSLNITEIRSRLTELGFSDDVHALNQKRPAAKKADWVKLLTEKQQ